MIQLDHHRELDVIFDALDKVRITDAAQAFPMPGAFYTSEPFLDIEREQLFTKKWVCVGREEEIPEPGDYFTTEIVGEPVVLIRTSSGDIKALSNVCRHRAMRLVEGVGNTQRFVCPYHAWTYDQNGRLLKAQGVGDQHDEYLRSCALPQFKCESWHGFLFVNLDNSAVSLLDSTAVRELEPMVRNMHIEDLRLVYSSEQEWDANWKCLVENFLEGYHLSTLHHATLHPYTPTRLGRHFPAGADYFGFYSWYPDDAPTRGESHPDVTNDERRRSLMLGLAPGSVFGISGFKVTYNLIQPVSATRLRTKIGMIGRPGEASRVTKAGVELFKRTFEEDKYALVGLMAGLQSRSYVPSVLANVDREGTIWDFYTYLARNISRNHFKGSERSIQMS